MTPKPPNKHLLLAVVAVSAPLSMCIETVLRKVILGEKFQEIREFLRPRLLPYAWAVVALTALSIVGGFALYRKLLRRGMARLAERRSDPVAVARVELEAMFLATSAPQIPTLFATILFQWGASLVPVAVCMALSTFGVLLLGLVGPKREPLRRSTQMRAGLCALMAALVAPKALSAQRAAVTLTLREALASAGTQPPAVRAAMARAVAQGALIDLARAAYYPTLTTTANGTIGYSDRPFLPATTLTPAQRLQNSSSSVDSSLVGRVTLYDFGRTASAVTSAERGAQASREDARSSARLSMAQAAGAFITVLADRELIAAVRTTITQREAQLRISEGLVSAGARPPIERTRSEVSLDAARLDLTTAQATEQSDRALLAASVGIDPTTDIDVTPVADAELDVSDEPVGAAALAISARPEFEALRARLAQTESQLSQARAARYPVLSASASGSLAYNQVLTGRGLGGLSESVSGGVSISWPIVDMAVRANIRVAECNVVSAREALLAQSVQVRTEAVQAAITARSARASLAQSERLAQGAASNLEQAQGRYQGGAAPLLELVDAQAADASARIGVVRAHAALNLSRARLLAVTGQLEALALR